MKKKLRILFLLFPFMCFSQDPNWKLTNASSYSLDAILIIRVKVDDEFLNSDLDKVAAFSGDELRGVTSLIKDGNGKYYAYLTVLSNAAGEEITFKVFDESSKSVLLVEDTVYSFVSSDVVGSLSSPYVLNTAHESLSSNVNTIQDTVKLLDLGEGRYRVLSEGVDAVRFVCFDLYGRNVMDVLLSDHPSFIDLSSLASGTYIGVVYTETARKIIKFVR